MEKSKVLSIVILYALIAFVMLGIFAGEGLVKNGMWWLMLILIFAPFIVGYLISKSGIFDWLAD